MHTPYALVRSACSAVWDEVAVSQDVIAAIWDPVVVVWEFTKTAVLAVATDWSSWISGSQIGVAHGMRRRFGSVAIV
jgi:hypothetical protein